MEEIKNCELNAEELADVAGGQTGDPNGAHWQALNANMGTGFIYNGHLWHRLASGETLGGVAAKYGVSVDHIASMNRATIQNVNQVYAGDALVVKRNPTN